jgi:hypothetical protein
VSEVRKSLAVADDDYKYVSDVWFCTKVNKCLELPI